jgi:hypothetical protein
VDHFRISLEDRKWWEAYLTNDVRV